MRLSRAFATLLLLSAATFARAQYSVADVVFEGGAPYTDTELLTVSGLAPGQLLVHDSLANAAQHLLDTGLFTDAQVFLSGQGKARTVHVTVKPASLATLYPASFENLVWFTPDELTQGIHARVPLYRGAVAEAGNTSDSIQAALQQMLTEKGVSAKLSHDLMAPIVQHPARVMNFKVSQPQVTVADVHLSLTGPTGASAQLTPGLQKAVNQAVRAPYNEGLTSLTIEDRLLSAPRSAGYVAASLDHIQRTFAPVNSNDRGIGVTYTARIVTGDVYKLSALTLLPTPEPTPFYTAADLTHDTRVHPGDIADLISLDDTATHVVSAWLMRGYMDASISAIPTLDAANHTVAYALKVTPGPVYTLGTLAISGDTPATRKFFDSVWPLKIGDPYSDQIVNTFLRKNAAQPAFKNVSLGYQASTNPDTHLVDLTITFVAQ
jgi:outer membrane protein insertion porin family